LSRYTALIKQQSFLNPGSSYGLPLVNLLWTVLAVISCHGVLLSFGSRLLNTRRDYDLLPSENTTEDDEEEQEDIGIECDPPIDTLLTQNATFFLWSIAMLISLFLLINGYEGFYFIHYWFIFNSLASFSSHHLYFNWTSLNSVFSSFPRVIENYPESLSLALFSISTIIPFLLTLDVFQEVFSLL
jgi:hypothetical protein